MCQIRVWTTEFVQMHYEILYFIIIYFFSLKAIRHSAKVNLLFVFLSFPIFFLLCFRNITIYLLIIIIADYYYNLEFLFLSLSFCWAHARARLCTFIRHFLPIGLFAPHCINAFRFCAGPTIPCESGDVERQPYL